ncbi:MAG: hypothetical protein R3E44_01140 [Paracoccaceae bacterium]
MIARKSGSHMAAALFLGLLLAAFPIRFDFDLGSGPTLVLSLAYAKGGGGGNSGPGGGGNSGHGNSGDDDDDDDDDDNSGRGNSRDAARIGPEDNIDLKYVNGWRERIENGRYILIDPKGRTVSDRWARPEDLFRLRELLGQ